MCRLYTDSGGPENSSPASCMRRLAAGDGELVISLCDAWRPSHLFLDFDRTLCTTRGGANPCLGQHTVDSELHEAAVAMGGATHIVTRNRHTREIASFLEERGVPVAAVHTVPSGESKWRYMESALAGGGRGLFVDDDAREVSDPNAGADVRLFRVLFQRW